MSIQTRLIPVATASTQEHLIEITEKVCKPYCINSTIQPSASVVFTQGSNTILNSNIICPITATITVVTPNTSGCGCSHTQVFTEKFDLAFNEGTTNVVSLAAGASTLVTPANVKCCKAYGVKLTTSLTATIA